MRGVNDVEASEKSDREGLGIMTDHAASNESSLMMYYYPELVRMEQLSTDSAQWPLTVAGKDPRLHASDINLRHSSLTSAPRDNDLRW